MNRIATSGANILVVLLTIVLCLLCTELIFRLIDGYRLTSVTLVTSREPDPGIRRQFFKSMVARARRYAADVTIDPEFQPEWYDSNPPEVTNHTPTFPLPADWTKAVANAVGRQQRELRYWYNYNFVKRACETKAHYEELSKFKKNPGFVYTFAGPDDTENPEIRYVPHGWDLGTATYNNFGFRGSDVSFPKPAQTVRIAFLGQSTTENGWPWTYPDFVVQILREWARAKRMNVDFDVVNAGRAGVGSPGIARIMRYEVAPLQPDIVVLYTGAANLRPEDVLPGGRMVANKDSLQTFMPALKRYSSLAIRLSEMIMTPMQGLVSEPAKPPHRLTFDLLQDVDLDRIDLPFRLHQEIADIRDIAQVSRTIGADLFLTSSIVLAHDGLQLDPNRHRLIFEQLNGYYAPLTYAEIRRGAEFENRVYRALSAKDHLGFIEIDKYFPQDPDLFADTVHFADEPGFRLQAWIIAQQLAPFIDAKLRKHELPRHAVANKDQISWSRQTPKKFDLNCLL